MQVDVMKISQSFCLDATHWISSRKTEVLYSLVTCHLQTGKGVFAVYMIANNNSVGPINRWLVHLRDMSSFSPLNISIDCSIPKVNTVKARYSDNFLENLALPHVAIHYCDFHVLRAWQGNMGSKVSLSGEYTSGQLNAYKKQLKDCLKDMLVESIYVTNNYAETWQNQLKKVYFKRTRVRRLDRLVSILTNNVEFYYEQEVERIHLNNGRMGPVENELSRHSLAASHITDDILPSMLLNPFGEIDSVSRTTSYNTVPAKTSRGIKYRASTFIWSIAKRRQEQKDDVVDVVGEEVEERGEVEKSRKTADVFDRICAHATAIYREFETFQISKTIPGLDQTKAEKIKIAFLDALRLSREYKEENPSYFKDLITQK
ncbi:hypothetical protein PHYBLDRAFT_152619 [Phycomyces blakesleeanus NRRL 1555(-)]|uniref:MULE transposase domain-containing protein n=1 Tax=Phycomyces blakesleeanus (strain ATCC 8743b / DSM 1359 / FGSC 10004 / NBRC 33097 / NRRL 1555) TaxID=763407 RepID=A0A162TDN1_PHYB8|nr:hypothetical protein PHYBLDRAFT_152619 [Phycomyces blakesleeanus NRRL 1555(-)]OAD66293.1 hypothetical protein PHYBLDRAFT_152619 [Phycomyces blakesleeanus NRRL 1555(-)]|eukprot:XP_018284333.1 hypothetical protein PHYBLDRAFT_152619 [Phycomyces blakesleeanus NRRL 1555(-)]